MLKNLFIIGAAKSGTSTLHDQLATFNEIAGVKGKEPHYFCNSLGYCKRNLYKYKALFEVSSRTEYLLDSSTGYFQFPQSLDHISSITKNSFIIVLLRNPVDRFISHYTWLAGLGDEQRSLREVVDYYQIRKPLFCDQDGARFGYKHYGAWGLYGENLQQVYNYFEKDKVRVIFFEDFIQDCERELNDIRKWLGLKDDGMSCLEACQIRSNESVSVRFPSLLQFVSGLDLGQFKGFLPKSLVNVLSNCKKIVRDRLRVINMPVKKSQINSCDRELIADLYRDDYLKLIEEMRINPSDVPWDDFGR